MTIKVSFSKRQFLMMIKMPAAVAIKLIKGIKSGIKP